MSILTKEMAQRLGHENSVSMTLVGQVYNMQVGVYYKDKYRLTNGEERFKKFISKKKDIEDHIGHILQLKDIKYLINKLELDYDNKEKEELYLAEVKCRHILAGIYKTRYFSTFIIEHILGLSTGSIGKRWKCNNFKQLAELLEEKEHMFSDYIKNIEVVKDYISKEIKLGATIYRVVKQLGLDYMSVKRLLDNPRSINYRNGLKFIKATEPFLEKDDDGGV